ncbi:MULTISPECIES: phage portal protein family protein [unclassified Dietzia]|uniref:phage portal protein family protein n=1 Tax=unclassified Dietzia TaxID=2617939 RepID=UPI0015F88439|nr:MULTISPECIES: hypothetical protein [unclassified Dietzia]MBB1022956.1 hypothetical protein [Dietzia sp. DQ12-76]MBB1026462.1 hypothetical protein [Dietzia sp. DQ11-38-2]
MADKNRELVFPQSARIYAQMLREDAQVRSVVAAVTLPILRTMWRIDPNGASDEVVRLVAEDLRLPVLGDDGRQPLPSTGGHASWAEHLPWALRSVVFGVSFFEKVYEVRSGRDRLRKLAPRMADTIKKINVADDGGLESVEQAPRAGALRAEKPIPVEHLVAYLHDPLDHTWTGTSILRSAYKHWRLKDELLRLEAIILERNGMGVPNYKAASSDEKEIERGQEIVDNVRAGVEGGVSTPNGASFTIEGVKGQLVSPRDAIAYHDSQIARAALAHVLNLDGKGGSYALAEVQLGIFIQFLQTIAEGIATTANKYLVEEMVDFAFGTEGGPYPRLAFDPIGSKNDLPPETIALLANAGVILPDKDLEEEIRRRGNLPTKRPYDGPEPSEEEAA